MTEEKALVIWLDDIRDPKDFGVPDAIWVKSARGMLMLAINLSNKDQLDQIEEIHFDNDLGENSPEGYHVFLRVEAMLHDGGLKGLKRIYVHSSNPSAVHKFMLASRSLKYHFDIDMIRRPL